MCQNLGGTGHPSLLPQAAAHVPVVLVASSVWEGTVILPTGASVQLSQVPRLPVPGTAVRREEPGVGLVLELLVGAWRCWVQGLGLSCAGIKEKSRCPERADASI